MISFSEIKAAHSDLVHVVITIFFLLEELNCCYTLAEDVCMSYF